MLEWYWLRFLSKARFGTGKKAFPLCKQCQEKSSPGPAEAYPTRQELFDQQVKYLFS